MKPMNINLDRYKALGVSREASSDEISRAFRKLSTIYHPDKAQRSDVERDSSVRPWTDPWHDVIFRLINDAHQVLSNPETRAQYDQFLEEMEERASGGAIEDDEYDEDAEPGEENVSSEFVEALVSDGLDVLASAAKDQFHRWLRKRKKKKGKRR